jgi:hypothetical protein
LVRFYRFNNPIADWHSWRQADTSAVSRNFAKDGFDVLHPKFDDLSNVPSGIDNPNGYRFVEFPIYNVIQGATFKYLGVLTLEEWGRLTTIFASMLSAGFLFLIIKKRFGKTAGLLTSFFFLFLPFNIYYSRVILPDPSMVMASLGGIYFFQKWIEKDLRFTIYDLRFILALLFTAVAFLLKPYALFFTLPMVYLAFEKFRFAALRKWQLWLLLIISVIPLILWRLWIVNFPAGIPVSAWLFNGNHIRFRPSFFYWIFYVRLTRLILGFFGVGFVIFAFIKKYKYQDLFFILSFVLASLIYLCVLASGNVQHDYYQILIIPSIAIVLGLGSHRMIKIFEQKYKLLGVGVFLILTGLSFYFAWDQVKDYFNINNYSIVIAGDVVDKLTPKNAKVIANYTGDTSFLYQTKRKGWASFEKPLPEMVNNLGADYLVLANPTEVDLGLGKSYKIIALTKQYVIFNLRIKP